MFDTGHDSINVCVDLLFIVLIFGVFIVQIILSPFTLLFCVWKLEVSGIFLRVSLLQETFKINL